MSGYVQSDQHTGIFQRCADEEVSFSESRRPAPSSSAAATEKAINQHHQPYTVILVHLGWERLGLTNFLSASLYVSKRGAY